MKTTFILNVCISFTSFSQDLTIAPITPLSSDVYETSGLLYLEDRIITHNDSGGQPWLYEIDSADGSILRTVVVANASNIDWEEVTQDETSIYICDFGNNAGTRTNLRIYKISILDYLTSPNDTVYCDTISFNYTDQVDFIPATYTTNFDAEAMISKDDSLYIFTKNWGNYKTHIYALSKTPGDYAISRVDELNVACLVTGAAYDPLKNELLLTGYTLVDPVVVFVNAIESNQFSAGALLRFNAAIIGSIQIEGIASVGEHQFFISSEKQGSDASMLHLARISDFINLADTEIKRPEFSVLVLTDQIILSEMKQGYETLIMDLNGRICLKSESVQFPTGELQSGLYVLLVYDELGNLFHTQKIMKF